MLLTSEACLVEKDLYKILLFLGEAVGFVFDKGLCEGAVDLWHAHDEFNCLPL